MVFMKNFDWKKNKDVANHLMNYSSKEEYQRSAISRFYYSCFGPSKDYYEKAFMKILPSFDAHQTLISSLCDSPFVEEQDLGNELKKLRLQRNIADYNHKSMKFNVKQQEKMVNTIFSMLDNLNKKPVRKIN